MWWLWPHFKRLWAMAATVIAGLTINYLYGLWGKQSVPSLRDLSDSLSSYWYWTGGLLSLFAIVSVFAARAHRRHEAPHFIGAVVGRTGAKLPPHRAPVAAAPPIAGREDELAQLREWFASVRKGERRVVFVSGEAGIGKTTFVTAFLDELGNHRAIRIGRGQCVEQYGAGEPYMPMLEAVTQLGRGPQSQHLLAILHRLAPAWLAQLPTLLTAEERARIQGETHGLTQQRMLREMTETLAALAAEAPLVLLLEDLHWGDASTLDLIAAVARRTEPARLLVIGTYRPIEMLAGDHPLHTLKRELELHGQCHELRLKPLSEGNQVENNVTPSREVLPEPSVRNLADPSSVWPVRAESAAPSQGEAQLSSKLHWRGAALVFAGLATIVAAIVLVQHGSFKSSQTSAVILSAMQPVPPSDIPSLAVLPFANLSGDANQEYFSDGITDELITMLSRLSNLLVIARTSSFTYKNKPAKAQDIGRELGVKYLLEGSVRKSQDRVRIEARLVEAASGAEFWADHFDRPVNEIFAVQDQIVQTIVTTLNLQMSLLERGALARAHQTTDNPEAYDDVLRGLVYRWKETKEDDGRALTWFEKAVELDPNYVDAYVLMSATIFNDWDWQWTQDPNALKRSFEFVQKALELDDSHPTAHVILGRLLLEQHQFDAAVAETNRGLSLAPNDTGNYYCSAAGNTDWAADTMNWSGRPAEALEIAEKAIRRDPNRRDFHLAEIGLAYYKMGRAAEAIPVLKRFIDSYPGFMEARYVLAACYAESGMMKEARAEASEIMNFSPQFSLEAGLFKGLDPQDRLISDLRKAGLK